MPGSSIERDAIVGTLVGVGASAVAIVATEIPPEIVLGAFSVVWRLEDFVSVPSWARWAVLGAMIIVVVLEVRRWRR